MAPIAFEWDEGNVNKSTSKHSISPTEAESSFADKNKVIFYDRKHSGDEIRYICIGKSEGGAILTSYFTTRNVKIRIIGTRKASKIEKAKYESFKQE
jgi:uncharacterized DUF497 family protein